MSDQFVAEIRIFGFNFAPKGWAFCNGQLLPISQNTALFSLLGTTYGGDGKSTFALPNLQGATPMSSGQGPGLSDRSLGEQSGSQNVTLLQSEIPLHTHALQAYTGDAADSRTPGPAAVLGIPSPGLAYSPTNTGLQQMNAQAVGVAGGSLPHNNLQPYLTLNFCIAMQGIFPPRG
jgi:microcystin-dependent protein